MPGTDSFVFVDGCYQPVVDRVYGDEPALANEPWGRQNGRILAEGFGCADAWQEAFRARGAVALDVITGVPPIDRGLADADYECFKDAVVLLRHPSIAPAEWDAMRTRARKTVFMLSSAPPEDEFLRTFDLIVSHFPHTARRLEKRGFNVRYLPLAFDPRRIGLPVTGEWDADAMYAHGSWRPWVDRYLRVTFAGGLGIAKHWAAGQNAIGAVASRIPGFQWFGYAGKDDIPPHVRKQHRGEAWGRDYFDVLGRSRLTLNRHGEVHSAKREDGPGRDWFACNMRLFEATGMGACLFTEQSANLTDLFEPFVEVVPFISPRDLAQRVRYYLDHPHVARTIAERGQQRVLNEHTYFHRAGTLLDWLADL